MKILSTLNRCIRIDHNGEIIEMSLNDAIKFIAELKHKIECLQMFHSFKAGMEDYKDKHIVEGFGVTGPIDESKYKILT